MSDVFRLIFGLALGGLLAWYWAASRVRANFLKQLDEAKKQEARAAEFAKHKFKQKEDELLNLRSRLEEERQAARVTQARLQADYGRVSDEKAQLEKAATELTETMNTLKAEVQTARVTQIRLQADHKRASDEKAQLERATTELTETVNTLKAEVQTARVTQIRLQADHKRVSDENAQLENATARLTETVNVLTTELRVLNEEGFRELEQFHDIGMSLKRTIEAYSQVVASMESHLEAIAQRSKHLQVPGEPPIPLSKSQSQSAASGGP